MKIAITPQQRFRIYQLIASAALRVKGQEARKIRRFYRHMGFEPLAEAEARGGNANPQKTMDTRPALHELDAEDIVRLGKLDDETERSPADEHVLGPLFDDIQVIKAQEGPWAVPVDVPDYIPEPRDSWLPVGALKAPEETELELVLTYLKANYSTKTGPELIEALDKGDHRPG